MSPTSLEIPPASENLAALEPPLPLDPARPGPIRAELLGLERLEATARRLASACALAPRRRVNSPLLKRFMENRRVLIRARREILRHDRPEARGLDADWLADNFHIVDDTLREIVLDLPRGYDVVLPKLAAGPLCGYPRVHALASTLVAHTDSELAEATITRFVEAFQQVMPLTIGELWALPTMLRLVLVENLRRLAEQMFEVWEQRLLAERWSDQAWVDPGGPGSLPSDPLVVRLMQLLRDRGPEAAGSWQRLEAELAAHGLDPDEVLRRENHRQAANQITIGNCVLSLRLLSAIDWNSFFEQCSLVEKTLRDDPGGAYPLQDFATSDRYRKAVERIARGSGADELDVARKAVELARAGLAPDRATGHVGYYLTGPGESELRRTFGYRPELRERLLDWANAHPSTTYFGAIGLALAMLMALVCGGLLDGKPASWAWLPILALAALLPLSELAVGLVNHLLTLVLPPRVLPKLQFKESIPEEFATIVVMPAMLVRPGSAEALLERLETHYLADPIPGFRFALLTDFADSAREQTPEDEALVRDAMDRVRALNRRYAGDGPELFFLFHRRRLWNPSQECWMGWERKRGKLSEFNRLLRGDTGTSYSWCSSEPSRLPRIRFVITLDADTQMPRDAAGRMVGTLAHPLNQPRFDPAARRVVEGYGILQPRVSFHLTAATHSRFAALLAASGGIDPYSTAASDAYMDLFGLGSFTGKGIYDLDAFEAATGATFPENHILSHDLIEGNYARCGLLSDTELFDDFPARYHAYARREHRWVRGDWQLLPWLARAVPTPGGRAPNPLPTLERWKLLDNLRRSLVPPALVVLLVLGWTVLPGSPWVWTTTTLAVLALPLIKWFMGVAARFARTGSPAGLRSWRESVPALGGQGLLAAVFLADQARSMCDAVARTLVRLLVTRRRLLEWETAAATEQRLGTGLADFIRGMWPSPALAVAVAVLVAVVRPPALWAAMPLLAAWFVAPLVAFWVSRPRQGTVLVLGEDERRAFRRIARKTWRFFATFVGDPDHWLPPDNYQEVPDGRIAHRTSPTNQGLLLVSTLAAHDLGYIGLGTLVDRLEKSFNTLERLERHWGHFYNWYDTSTLKPLPPAYISTVDSGNFLGCLLALGQGLKEKSRQPVLGPAVVEGLRDAFDLIDEPWLDSSPIVAGLLREPPGDWPAWAGWLERLEREARSLHARIAARQDEDGGGESEAWAAALLDQVRERRAEIAALAPWMSMLRDREIAVPLPRASMSLEEMESTLRKSIADLEGTADEGAKAIATALKTSSAADLLDRLRSLIGRAEAMGAAMDFRPLYKPDRHLYAIGINLSQGQLDGPCYDLLASESCLTSYLTVARGDAPRRHWFQLGRPYIHTAGRTGLISWGGTMFEYLMPRLLLRSLPDTLLAEACETAVARQIEYGRECGIPWGVSESAYNAQYLEGDYRYQSFGVPGLGLKRGLEKDWVVAPYATAMAAMIAPREALENLRRLAHAGAEGPYGFYEAVDYTPDRLPHGQRLAVVRSYMAHHQGMTLVALTNVLMDDLMARRFHTDPMVKAADLLLQERVPADPPIVDASPYEPRGEQPGRPAGVSLLSRRLTTPATAAPRTHLLTNAQYHVMVTNAGSGYSRCQGLDVTRWREDPTCEGLGQFFYVRDLHAAAFWSAGHLPACARADAYEVVFSTDKAVFRRRDGDIATSLEITVSPERRAEVRRITLTNHGGHARELELTSFMEPVLADHGADAAHPAFGKLFLETERIADADSLLCRRRPRSAGEHTPWAVHVMAVDGSSTGCVVVGKLQYETDRARFLGRGRTTAGPAALDPGARLSGTTGPVLDPVLSLRRTFRIAPGGSAVVGFTLALADTRDAALALADTYHGISAVSRAFELAWAHSQVEHGHQNWSPEDAHLYQRLGSHLLYAGSAMRAHATVLAANRGARSALRRWGISGDRPILLARIAEKDELALAGQLLAAHAFLRLKGLELDLVLLDEETVEDGGRLGEQLSQLISQAGADESGSVFLIRSEGLADADANLLEASARVVLDGSRGPLSGQLDRVEWGRPLPEDLVPSRPPGHWDDDPVSPPADLQFANGLGGFTPDGREYCVLVGSPDPQAGRLNGQPAHVRPIHPILPPMPWVNVVANAGFGFLVSEAGSGFTWAGNSQTNRLTGWSNDPVADPPSEVIYLRDEETGQVWCPTPLPIPSRVPTLVRHGQGYTTFERNIQGIEHDLTLFVPDDAPIKLIRLRLRNPNLQARRLTATFYAEWVLGRSREATAMHVVTEIDTDTEALMARNAFRDEFGGSVAFIDVNRRPRKITGDRNEFLGRHGSLASPAAMGRAELSGRAGAGMDPCGAVQTPLELAPGATTEIIFLLGEAEGVEEARRLIREFWDPDRTAEAFRSVRDSWDRTLRTIQVRTPDPGMDLLLNRWLLYQVMSCRLRARSSLYQSGGAFGFRDQIQDVCALVHSAPREARAHILRAAARQYLEGDVQHWWHPPAGLGVRTRISDDPAWLPHAVARYVETTGDHAILDEQVPYLEGPSLPPGREDEFGLPTVSRQSGSLHEHCRRALDRVMRLGPHDLPLMGTGDWNDGMNRVGALGKGESVWLAWFLIDTLRRFAAIAETRGDAADAARDRGRAEALRAAIEEHAWDGDWYLRAFDDSGVPLGSARNAECQIDSIAQSWAVISDAAEAGRSRRAMESVQERLVSAREGLIRLLDPPFDKGRSDPGYIKGYPPGIRENGAQYTHAAVWVAQAVAQLGQGRRAHELFRILNPIDHAGDPAAIARYQVEPYVVAGDIYGRPPHVGRGGWTWYTGAAGWLYRLALESILGFRRAGDLLTMEPCIPSEWPGFEIAYRFESTDYRIVVENPRGQERGVAEVWLDGRRQDAPRISLVDDRKSHEVKVVMGPP